MVRPGTAGRQERLSGALGHLSGTKLPAKEDRVTGGAENLLICLPNGNSNQARASLAPDVLVNNGIYLRATRNVNR